MDPPDASIGFRPYGNHPGLGQARSAVGACAAVLPTGANDRNQDEPTFARSVPVGSIDRSGLSACSVLTDEIDADLP